MFKKYMLKKKRKLSFNWAMYSIFLTVQLMTWVYYGAYTILYAIVFTIFWTVIISTFWKEVEKHNKPIKKKKKDL